MPGRWLEGHGIVRWETRDDLLAQPAEVLADLVISQEAALNYHRELSLAALIEEAPAYASFRIYPHPRDGGVVMEVTDPATHQIRQYQNSELLETVRAVERPRRPQRRQTVDPVAADVFVKGLANFGETGWNELEMSARAGYQLADERGHVEHFDQDGRRMVRLSQAGRDYIETNENYLGRL